MNDLEVLQRACPSRENPIQIPYQTPPAKIVSRRKPYWSVAITVVGLIVLALVSWHLFQTIPVAHVAVYGEPSGAAFTIVNLDDRPITLEKFIVNEHYRIDHEQVIPSGDGYVILCFALEDEAGKKFVPTKLTQAYHGVEVICSASGRADYKYRGKPGSPPTPTMKKSNQLSDWKFPP